MKRKIGDIEVTKEEYAGLSANKKFTPRQRVAISYPVTDVRQDTHPRHHKVTAPFQSILTFNFMKAADAPAHGYVIDGVAGVWYARITTFPQRPLSEWDDGDVRVARNRLQSMLARVGGVSHVLVTELSDAVIAIRAATKGECEEAIKVGKIREHRAAISKEVENGTVP